MRQICNKGLVDGIFSLSLVEHFIDKLSKQAKNQLDKKAEELRKIVVDKIKGPLSSTYYEDTAVEATLEILKTLGWKAKDKRSTPLPHKNDLKPDIWLNSHESYCEVVARGSGYSMTKEFEEHAQRTTLKYCFQSKSNSAIVSDGRAWLLASALKEFEGAFFFVDFKKMNSIEHFRSFVFLFSPTSPVVNARTKRQITNLRPVGINTFKNKVLKSFTEICLKYEYREPWRDFFAYCIASLFSEHNSVFRVPYKQSFIEIATLLTTNDDGAFELFWKHVAKTSKKSGKGDPIGVLSKRLSKFKNELNKTDLLFLLKKFTLPESNNYYIGWQDLTADDISEIYEKCLKGDRKSDGIYATPLQLAEEIVYESYRLHTKGNTKLTNFVISDSSCGSGAFLVAFVRRIILGPKANSELLMPERRCTYSYKLVAQDKHLIASVLTYTNVLVAYSKGEWIPELSKFDLSVETFVGDSTDKNSDFFKTLKIPVSNAQHIVLGNPPFVRGHASHNRKVRSGSEKHSNENLLFPITRNSIPSTDHSSLAYIIPTAVLNTKAAGSLQKNFSTVNMFLNRVWIFSEGYKLFTGCSAQKHAVIFLSSNTSKSQVTQFKGIVKDRLTLSKGAPG